MVAATATAGLGLSLIFSVAAVAAPWTRVAGETFSDGACDNALYYTQASTPAPGSLTVTISAGAATYLAGSASDYTGLAPTASLD